MARRVPVAIVELEPNTHMMITAASSLQIVIIATLILVVQRIFRLRVMV